MVRGFQEGSRVGSWPGVRGAQPFSQSAASLPLSTTWRFKSEASQEACRFVPQRSRANSTPRSKPHTSIPSPSVGAHLVGLLGDSAALNFRPSTGRSDSDIPGHSWHLEGA